MSKIQIDKIAELTKQGYMVLAQAVPPIDPVRGASALVQAPDGKKYLVSPAGEVTPAPAGTAA